MSATLIPAHDLDLPPGFIPPAPPVPAVASSTATSRGPVAPLRIEAVRQHDGRPVTHLSKSSFETFAACPEAWRRRYLLGERTPTAPRMVLGTIVDNALTWLAEQRIAGHEPELGELRAFYLGQAIPAALARERHGIAWSEAEGLADLRRLGWRAILAFGRDLAPLLGRPQAAQRRLELRLHRDATWAVLGFPDLELVTREAVAVGPDDGELIRYEGTPEPVAVAVEGRWVRSDDRRKPRGRDYLNAHGLPYEIAEREVEEVVDYKVVARAPTQADADSDLQITTYLAGRALEGRPAERLRLAIMAKPTRTLGFRCAAVSSYRTASQYRGALARYANLARAINACWREFGPDQPWPYADPKGSWRCSPAACDFWSSCAGGRGL